MKPNFMAILCSLYSDTTYSEWLEEDVRSRRDRRIPRCALRTYVYSKFRKILKSGNNQACINATGHDLYCFCKLLRLFEPVYVFWTFDEDPTKIRRKVVDTSGRPKGSPRDMTLCNCLRVGTCFVSNKMFVCQKPIYDVWPNIYTIVQTGKTTNFVRSRIFQGSGI